MDNEQWASSPFPRYTDAQVAEVVTHSPVAEVIGEHTPFAERPDGTYSGCCPFCSNAQSLVADPATGRWFCTVCLETGSVVVFISKMHELWWGDAVKWLADRAGLDFGAAS